MSPRVWLWAALLVLAPGTVLAGGFSNVEFGTKRMGMFAVIANVDDPSAIFHNPAALTQLAGTNSYFSVAWFLVDASVQLYDSQGILHPEEPVEPTAAQGVSPFLGLVTDFGTQRFRFGVAAYAPNVFGTSLPEDSPTRYNALDAFFVASRFTASAAYRVTDRLSVALNGNLLAMYLEASRMLNPAVLENPDQRFDPSVWESDGRLELEGLGYALSWDAAIHLQLTDTLQLGGMFSSGAPVELEGDVRFTQADGEVLETTHHTSLAIPFALQGGASWEFAPDFELGLDVRYWHYQVFQEQVTRLDDPLTDFNIEELRDPKNYKNSWNVGVGLLHRFAPGWDFMLGYQRDWSPIPDHSLTLENPNPDRHGIAVGVRWQALEEVRLGAAFLRNWYDIAENQESATNPPNNARGHGENMALGFDVLWNM